MGKTKNNAKIEFQTPANGLLDIPGFYSFFSVEDKNNFESRFINVDEKENGETGAGKETLFFFKEDKSVILRPDLSPIDMSGDETLTGYAGDDYEILKEDGTAPEKGMWEIRKVVGAPSAICEFQKYVKIKTKNDIEVVPAWTIHSGRDVGKWRQGTAFQENQGFCAWIANNVLPENEKKSIKFTIAILDNQRKWKEGVYVEIVDGKDVALAHVKTVKTNSTIPPKQELRTQWESFTLPRGQKIYSWSGDVDVFCLFFVNNFIILSINGIDNYKAIACQYYDIGKDIDGNEYPILINEGADFWIESKGQALVGFKRAMFASKGSLQTKLIFPSYKLEDPKIQISKKIIFPDTKISGTGFYGGKQKIGGKVQIGPLATVAWENGAYGEVMLEGKEVDGLSGVSYYTPILYEFAIVDERKRKTANISPADDLEGDIVSVDISGSSSSSDLSFSSLSSDVELEITNKEQYLSSIFEKKLLLGKLSISPRESEVFNTIGVSIYGRMSIRVAGYKETKMRLEGDSIVKRLEDMKLGVDISLEGLSDADAIKKLCDMAGFNVSILSNDRIILESGKDTKWVFSPSTTFWSAMKEVVKISGCLLYPDTYGGLIYRPVPTGSDAHKFSFSRDTSPITDIEYKTIDMWRTRLFVVGKADKDSNEFFYGDTLSGAIKHNNMENTIGYDLIYEEVNDAFSNWDLIRKRLEKLDGDFNRNNYFISFSFSDARNFLSLSLYDIFLWTDNNMPLFNNKKFIVTQFDFNIDAFNCSGNVTGKML